MLQLCGHEERTTGNQLRDAELKQLKINNEQLQRRMIH